MAVKKLQKLKSQYKGFINVGVDNWRGYHFILDTEDVRSCQNNCSKCSLYTLLKNEKKGLFSAGLYPASEKDKRLFGKQNYLNCKTLKQYQNCYTNFLIKKTKSAREIRKELSLIKNFKVIFSRENSNLNELEENFRKAVLKKVSRQVDPKKAMIIRKFMLYY